MMCDYGPYREPLTKGQEKIYKSAKEIAQTRPRLCHGCNKRGVLHDKRNCPTLLER